MNSERENPLICRVKPPLRRGAFTVLELIVAMGVVGALVALLMPALMAAREAARRTTCGSQLREIGVAIQHYHDRAGALPGAWRPAVHDPQFAYGWATQILPDLEQSDRWRRLSFQDRPATSADGELDSLPLLVCPSDITEPAFDLWEEAEVDGAAEASATNRDSDGTSPRRLLTLPTASYQGVFGTVEADDADEAARDSDSPFGDGSVIHDRKVRLADLERGLSNTLLVGERTMAMVPSTWLGVDLRGEDAACRLVGSAMTRPNCAECDECEFGSRHPGGALFAWADGHVSLVNDGVESIAYQMLAKRSAE